MDGFELSADWFVRVWNPFGFCISFLSSIFFSINSSFSF